VAEIGAYLRQADILVSPRVHGTNTPMKIYSYLSSGVPVVATDLPTHTQVLNPDIAVLAKPDAGVFAAALRTLLDDDQLRAQTGKRAAAYAAREHGMESFVSSVRKLYQFVDQRLCSDT
jgi:glycosyltransferase involved in cell wall biosynthesis